MNSFLIVLFVFAAAITYAATPLTISLAKKWKLLDDAKTRPHPAHTHEGIIPRAGGIPIFLGIFLPLVLFFPKSSQMESILLGATILLVVGLWDDRKNRSPYIRMLTNAGAAVCIVAGDITIPYITNPLNSGVILLTDKGISLAQWGIPAFLSLSQITTLLWIIWTTNIVGWSGGVDGQLPGFVAISAFVLGMLSLRYIQTDMPVLFSATLAFLTAGAFLGFLPWNMYPQKIMPGYGGKTLAGFLLAVLSILSFGKLGTALLVLAVPMTDASFMLLKRILSKRSPVWASSGHLHHHLLDLGWKRRQIAVFYWTISAAAGVLALSLSSTQKLFAGLVISVTIAGFILWINLIRGFRT